VTPRKTYLERKEGKSLPFLVFLLWRNSQNTRINENNDDQTITHLDYIPYDRHEEDELMKTIVDTDESFESGQADPAIQRRIFAINA
jgi:hypothetical protein